MIAELVTKSGLKPILFSRNTSILRHSEVLIVDTIGHLLGFYSVATVVFVGKSLTAKGGHNIIEPAIFGKPIIIGQQMQNFKDITQVFLADNAVIQVEDAVQLKKALLELLTKSELRRDLGDRARLVVRKNRGATVRTIDIIRTFFS